MPCCSTGTNIKQLCCSPKFCIVKLMYEIKISVLFPFSVVDINKCEVNPCKNGGTCILLEGDKFFCMCLLEYNGTICQCELQ